MYSAFNQHETESDEMKRLKLHIERQETQIVDFAKKLDFEQKEHESRIEQLSRRQKAELDIINAQLAKGSQLQKDRLDSQRQKYQAGINDAKREISHFESQRKRMIEELSIKYSQTFGIKNRNAVTKMAEQQVNKDQGILRINDQIYRQNQRIIQLENQIRQLGQLGSGEERRLKQMNNLDLKKIQQKQDKEKSALEDSWLRTQKYYEGRMHTAESLKARFKTEYENAKRQFLIDKKRREQEESRKRAQHGDQAAHQNYASTETSHPLRPENEQTEDQLAREEVYQRQRVSRSKWR